MSTTVVLKISPVIWVLDFLMNKASRMHLNVVKQYRTQKCRNLKVAEDRKYAYVTYKLKNPPNKKQAAIYNTERYGCDK